MGNIVLIGFMGAGKSTVARTLSELRGYRVLEMDAMIEEREGMTIPEIFRTRGEAYFRDAETKLLRELEASDGTVVSCGGGTPLRPENLAPMHAIGPVVWLEASPETVLERVREDHSRPLLENNKNAAFIAQMLEGRRPKYEAAADLRITTDGKTAREICRELLEKL